MEEESNLDEFKKDYLDIQKKYDLPSFEELNQDFHIEKLADVETDYLVREIRKMITDKFANYLRFVEAFLHPNNTPMFVLSIVKLINVEDKKNLVNIYEKLAKSEMKIVELDLGFSEEDDAMFVKDSYKLWQEIKKDLLVFVRKIETNWDNKPEVNGKNYFG
jgi:hypothetical protein